MPKIDANLSPRQLLDASPGTASLLAAFRVGLLDALMAGAATPDQYAADLGLDTTATALLLDVLGAYGLTETDGDGQVKASVELRDYARDSPGGVDLHLQLCEHQTQFLWSGVPLIVMDGSNAERGTNYRGVVTGLRSLYDEMAHVVAKEIVPIAGRVLDVGAGSGVWGYAIAEADPVATVTAVDLPDVIPILRAEASARQLDARVEAIANDYHELAVPRHSYHLVILGHVLHLETAERARRLIQRAWDRLRPGGRMLVVDVLRNETRPPSPVRAIYALTLSMRTRHGRVHRSDDVDAWLRAAGARQVLALSVPPATPMAELADVLVATG